MRDKKTLQQFIENLKKTQGLSKVKINYFFTEGRARDYDNTEIKESKYIINEHDFTIDVYFLKSDGFNKWVEVYVKAEEQIQDLESKLFHFLNYPDDFEFLKRNLKHGN